MCSGPKKPTPAPPPPPPPPPPPKLVSPKDPESVGADASTTRSSKTARAKLRIDLAPGTSTTGLGIPG